MPMYVGLLDWTDQGVRSFEESVGRYEAAAAQMEKLGVRFRDIYWTLGTHDLVGLIEAPDDESLAAAMLATARQGNIRTTTMRAFTRDEMRGVIERAGAS
jgi:uncharacterized protein with GYD domain